MCIQNIVSCSLNKKRSHSYVNERCFDTLRKKTLPTQWMWCHVLTGHDVAQTRTKLHKNACTFWVMKGHDLLHWDREISLTFSSRRRLLRTIFSHFISFKDKLMKPDIWTPEMFNFVEEWLFISFWLLKGSRLKTYWSALV